MSMINLRRYVEVEGHGRVGVEGFYTGRAIKNGVVMREFGCKLPVPNLITNLGMDAIGAGPSFTQMHLGTGTITPDVSQSSLAVFGVNITGPARTTGVSGASPYYGWQRSVFTSAVGAAAGSWTEIGISNQAANGGLRSRALILDAEGMPVAFPVQADEQFQGTYEFRVYAPEIDSLATVTLGSKVYETTCRALNVLSPSYWAPDLFLTQRPFISRGSPTSTLYTGGLAAVTAADPLGVGAGGGTNVNASYTNGSYHQDTSTRWGSGAAVGSRITWSKGLNAALFQIAYDPVIDKLSNEELILNLRTSWARR